MSAGAYNFICEQGATFARTITVKDANDAPRDFTNYSGRMHVRRRIDDVDTLVELTTDNGRMTLNSDGEVYLSMSPATTAAITDSGVYDLELEDASGAVERLIEGTFTLLKEVTR